MLHLWLLLLLLHQPPHRSTTTASPPPPTKPPTTTPTTLPKAQQTKYERFLHRVERQTDGTDDGRLSTAEIEQYIRSVVGGEHFDSTSEVQDATTSALLNIDTDATTSTLPNQGITTAELRSYWTSLKSLSTPDEVAEWVVHAVQLPQYAATFRANSVTGFDLPLLLQDQGSMFVELNVKSPLHQRMFERAIHMRLFGLAKPPDVVHHVQALVHGCSGVRVTWGKVQDNGGIKVHRYQLVATLRATSNDPTHEEETDTELYIRSSIASGGGNVEGQGDASSGLPPYEMKIFSGDVRSKLFHRLKGGGRYTFRVRAFNALGGGPWSPRTSITVSSSCKDVVAVPPSASGVLGALGAVFGASQASPLATLATLAKANSTTSTTSTSTSTNDAADFFNTIEANTRGRNDFKLKREEIKQYIQTLGGDSFDEASEVDSSTSHIFNSIDTHGGSGELGGNGIITPEELSRFWQTSVSGFTTNRDVADWMTYALRLPQYREAIVLNDVTPNDLSLLIANNGHLLRTKLGVRNEIHHAKVLRAIKMLLFGLGTKPTVVEGLMCQKTTVAGTWHTNGMLGLGLLQAKKNSWVCGY